MRVFASPNQERAAPIPTLGSRIFSFRREGAVPLGAILPRTSSLKVLTVGSRKTETTPRFDWRWVFVLQQCSCEPTEPTEPTHVP